MYPFWETKHKNCAQLFMKILISLHNQVYWLEIRLFLDHHVLNFLCTIHHVSLWHFNYVNQYTFIYEQYSCLIMISFSEPLIHIEILEVYCLTFDLGTWELPVQYNCISVRLKQSAPIKGRAIWRCFDLRNRMISFLKSPVSEFIGVTQQQKHDKDTKRLSEANSTDYAGQHFLLLTIYVYYNQSKENWIEFI